MLNQPCPLSDLLAGDCGEGPASPKVGHVWTAPGCQGILARCSIGRGSHVFGLFMRLTRPLAIMPSADRVPVKSSHSTMPWPKWGVPIAGSTNPALHAVCPFQPFLQRHCGAISFPPGRLSQRDWLLVTLALGHHGPNHPPTPGIASSRLSGSLAAPGSETKKPPPIREAAFASLKAPLWPVPAPVDPTGAREGGEASGR